MDVLDFLAPPFASRQKVVERNLLTLKVSHHERKEIKVNLGQGDCFVAYDIFRTENVLAPRNDDAFFVLRFL